MARILTLPVVFTLALGFFAVLHPAPRVPWSDTLHVVQAMRTRTLPEAVRWFAAYHTHARPWRAVEWWVAAQTLGARTWAYHWVNALALAGAVTVIASVSRLAAAFVATSYVTVYPLLHYPLALNFLFAVVGLALVWRGWAWAGSLALLLAALGHDIFAAWLLVPVMARWVNR